MRMQLSHHLVAHMDLRTGAETVVLALAVFYAWYMVAWGANWLDPDPLPVRGALVGLMFASLLMSVAIDDAFDGRAWLFVSGYLLLQVDRPPRRRRDARRARRRHRAALDDRRDCSGERGPRRRCGRRHRHGRRGRVCTLSACLRAA